MSLDTYDCERCGDSFGIAGENSGSDDDNAADEYYASEVEFHESGECKPKMDPQRVERIAGYRALADLLEAQPELPLPYLTNNGAQWNVWTTDAAGELARIVRLLPGPLAKNDPASDDYAAQYYELTGKLRGLTIRTLALS